MRAICGTSDPWRRTPRHAGKVRLLREFDPDADNLDVPDPHYGGKADFEHVRDLIEAALPGLLSEIRKDLESADGPGRWRPADPSRELLSRIRKTCSGRGRHLGLVGIVFLTSTRNKVHGAWQRRTARDVWKAQVGRAGASAVQGAPRRRFDARRTGCPPNAAQVKKTGDR
jgi:hypothetical protein